MKQRKSKRLDCGHVFSRAVRALPLYREAMTLPPIAKTMCLLCCFAVSNSMAEPGGTIISDADKTQEYLVLTNLTAVKLPVAIDQMTPPGFVWLSEQAKSPLVVYVGRDGGMLNFYGADQVAFVTNSTIQAILALRPQEISSLLASNKPMPYAELVQRVGKLPMQMPAVPVQTMPASFGVYLKTKPSNIILCKAHEQVFVIEVVAQGGNALQVKVHERFQDKRPGNNKKRDQRPEPVATF